MKFVHFLFLSSRKLVSQQNYSMLSFSCVCVLDDILSLAIELYSSKISFLSDVPNLYRFEKSIGKCFCANIQKRCVRLTWTWLGKKTEINRHLWSFTFRNNNTIIYTRIETCNCVCSNQSTLLDVYVCMYRWLIHIKSLSTKRVGRRRII